MAAARRRGRPPAKPAPQDGLLLEAFLEAMSAERGSSVNTREAYGRDIRQYLAHLRNRGVSAATAGVSDVRDYLGALARGGIGARSQARKLSALRQFHGFLAAEGWRGDDPTTTVEAPARERPLPRILTADQVGRLIETAHGLAGWRGARMTAMVEILYATGLRVSELVSLKRSSLSRDGRIVTVRGKRDRERLVPLGAAARRAVEAWLPLRLALLDGAGGRRASANPWLFPSRSAAGHLTRDRFAKLLRDLAESAGIEARLVSPHVLRHAFATHLLANGADLRSVQQMLGHADVATTEIYTRVLDDRLRSLVRDVHPLSDLRN